MGNGSMRLSMLNASFIPVVMSATGGVAHEATYFYKRLVILSSNPFPCYNQLFNAFVALVPQFDIML